MGPQLLVSLLLQLDGRVCGEGVDGRVFQPSGSITLL